MKDVNIHVRKAIVHLSTGVAIVLLMIAVLITGVSLILRYVASIAWAESFDFVEALIPWIALLGLPAVVDARLSAAPDGRPTRIGIVVQIALFAVLTGGGVVAAIQSESESHVSLDISMLWVTAALPVGCAMTCLVLLSRLYDVPRRGSTEEMGPMTAAIVPPALLLAATAWIAFFTLDGAARAVLDMISTSGAVSIAMMAIAGELARIVNAELTIRRLVQSTFAGARWAPVSAPMVAAALQGPMLMRSGRSFAGEIAREASEMLRIMESQGVDRGTAWNALASGSACSLVLPPSFVAVIAGMTINGSITILWFSMLLPGVLLATLLILAALAASSRTTPDRHPAPKLESSKVYQIWRDLAGGATLSTPLLVLGAVVAGVGTPSEIAGVVALQGFIVAFMQPVRPRFKDVVEALRRSVIVTADLMLAVAAAGTVIFVVGLMGWAPNIGPSMSATVLCGLLLPALLSFLVGIPMALVLSSAFVPLIGALVEVSSAEPTIKISLIIFAVMLGATLRACLFPPAFLGLTLTAARIRSACIWTLPLLLVWLMIWSAPGVIVWSKDLLF